MSSRPVDLFRASWRTALTAVSAIFALLTGLEALQLLSGESGEAFLLGRNGWQWGQSLGLSWLLALMVALILPWMLLSFYGEWLYTRALPRRQLFGLIRDEYVRWWLPLLLLLIGLVSFSQFSPYKSSGSELPWDLALFASSASLFGSLVLAATPTGLRKLVPATGLVLLWLLLAPDLALGHPALSQILSWVFCLALLAWAYRLVALQDQDLSLDRPGDGDDENKSLERMGLFRLLGSTRPVVMSVYRGFAAQLARLRLLTEHARMLYAQLLLVLGGLSLLFSLVHLRYSVSNWQLVSPDHSQFTVLICLGFSWCVLALVNPRFLLLERWEFLATRPISPRRAYLANWGLQGLFLAALAVLGLLAATLVPELLPLANLPRIAAAMLFLWLGGELAIGVLALLAGLSLTLTPALVIALLAVFYGQDWPALVLWALVAAWRAWDLLRFGRSVETSRSPLQAARRLLGHYLPPALAMLSLSWALIQLQPLPRLMARPGELNLSPARRIELAVQILTAIYTRIPGSAPDTWGSDPGYEAATLDELRGLLAAPRSPQAAAAMALKQLQRRHFDSQKQWRDFNPFFTSYYKHLADVWEWEKQEYRTIAYWAAASTGRNAAADLYLQAQVAELNQQFAQALQLVRQARALNDQADYAFYEGRLLMALLRFRPARAHFYAVAEAYPEHAAEALFQAGFAAQLAGQHRQGYADFLAAFARKPHHLIGTRLNWGRYYEQGLCDMLPRVSAALRSQPGGYTSVTGLDIQQKLCQPGSRVEPLQPRQPGHQVHLRSLWLLRNGQAARAADLLQKYGAAYDAGLQAEALQQAGRKAEALALVRHHSKRLGSDSSYLNVLLTPREASNQYQLQRLRLQLEPAPELDTGIQVLMRSPDPDRDWPLITARFKGRDPELSRLAGLRAQLRLLDRAFEAEGLPDAWHTRSLERTQVQLILAPQLPAAQRTPAFNQAFRSLRALLID